jgi:pimeloyl-ACP methyl ester carboxylesterase
LDTQHAGALGFSFGGAVAAEASLLDPRIRAAVNLDGRHYGDALERGVNKPYLFICEELLIPTEADLTSTDPATRYEARLDRIDYSQLDANLRARGGVRVTIPGVTHMNFTDVPLRSPLRRFSGGGTVDARRVQEIIRTYVVEFFSRYTVPGQTPALNADWPQFREARLETWPAPTS